VNLVLDSEGEKGGVRIAEEYVVDVSWFNMAAGSRKREPLAHPSPSPTVGWGRERTKIKARGLS